ncbi:hypothetical protein AHF37_04160 [Paragonimus kellicotti]|nr:hypothetical protein AHF37_04160 [Paragonimus kellicotti]
MNRLELYSRLSQNAFPCLVLSRSLAASSNKSDLNRRNSYVVKKAPKQIPVVEVWEGITVKELARAARREPSRVLTSLNSGMLTSQTASFDSRIEDRKLLVSLVNLMGLKPLFKSQTEHSHPDRDAYPRPPANPTDCVPRPPVVAVLGHVDHGKTTLLDALRSSRMVDEEYGGITQHLAAFTVSLASVAKHAGITDVTGSLASSLSDSITFLDTPGHAAFSAIRARGASATDIVVLVVAADDGVMPQTVESIRFAKEGNTPLVVAINKIDKREADVGRVLNELAAHGVIVEQLGGEVQSIEISALKRINLHGLLEALCLQAELMQIRSDNTGAAEGIILEANMEHGTGKVATCLVTRGQLRRTPASGPLVANESICSPRILLNDRGQPVVSVGPGFIAKVAGWKELPPAGSILLELQSMARAAEVVRFRRNQRMQKKAGDDLKAYTTRMAPYQAQYNAFLEQRSKSSRSLWRKLSKNRPDLQSLILPTDDDMTSLPLLIKTDVHGSMEAIQTLLSTCPIDECSIEIIQCGVGPLTESEVDHAEALGAIVLLFNVSALPAAMSYAETKGVIIKRYNIIYRLAEDVREFINARLPPLIVEKVVGEAEILELFVVKEPRGGGKPLRVPVAGCRCTKGQLISGQSGSRLLSENASLGDVVATCYRVIRRNRTSPALHNPTDIALTGSHDTVGLQPDDTIVVSQAICRSLRHEKTVVDSIRKGVECGLVLTTPEQPNEDAEKRIRVSVDQSENFVSNWQVGDLIQCYVLVKEPRKVQWEFETKSTEQPLEET